MTFHLRLAYRDTDRLPVIWCIGEMARRHYDVDVDVLRIRGTAEYEAALFDGSCDVIVEHLEYFFGQRAGERPVTMFCAPVVESTAHLVVRPTVQDVAELRGTTVAVRGSGRFHTVTQRIRQLGLEGQLHTVIVQDGEVGRWGQWKKVANGECSATFMSPLYLNEALSAGLKCLPTPKLPLVEHYAHACLTSFGAGNDEVLRAYMKAVVHALALLKFRRSEALEIVRGEPKRAMQIDAPELERRLEHIVEDLQVRPYPTLQALANCYEAAVIEYPEVAGINPLTRWDTHWLKQLDDVGFIDGLLRDLSGEPREPKTRGPVV